MGFSVPKKFPSEGTEVFPLRNNPRRIGRAFFRDGKSRVGADGVFSVTKKCLSEGAEIFAVTEITPSEGAEVFAVTKKGLSEGAEVFFVTEKSPSEGAEVFSVTEKGPFSQFLTFSGWI